MLFTFSVSPTDYGTVDTILIFDACQMKSCVNISIVDDIIQENDESFNVTLERTPDLDSRIILVPVNGVVQIIDDDGRYYYDDYMVAHRGNYTKSMPFPFLHVYIYNSQT